jgi:hypothetical protein
MWWPPFTRAGEIDGRRRSGGSTLPSRVRAGDGTGIALRYGRCLQAREMTDICQGPYIGHHGEERFRGGVEKLANREAVLGETPVFKTIFQSIEQLPY